jgi:hypothetical protein
MTLYLKSFDHEFSFVFRAGFGFYSLPEGCVGDADITVMERPLFLHGHPTWTGQPGNNTAQLSDFLTARFQIYTCNGPIEGANIFSIVCTKDTTLIQSR